MKKHLLILTAVLSSTIAHGQTNIYHPFPDSNAVWNFHFQWYCFADGTADEYYSIAILGDTIINSQTYHKLTTPFVQSFSIGTCGGQSTGYKGAIRQDTSNRKVFFVPPSSNMEELLYDFTMQIGDTVQAYTGMPTDTVQSIDSVLVGSTYRKRWNINTCYNIHFIEGVGSTYGLVEESPACITDLADYTLTCFQEHGQTLYPDTTTNCQLITSVNSIDIKLSHFDIYPTIVNDRIYLKFQEKSYFMNTSNYQIINIQGEIIQSGCLFNNCIDVSELPDGLYLLNIISTNSNFSSVQKFIKN